MLTLTIPGIELGFNDATSEFVYSEETVIELEHSLISVSKWESIWEKPFLSSSNHTSEQIYSYIEAMTLTPDVPPEVYQRLTTQHFEQINAYIDAKMTATWFSEEGNNRRSREIVTAEIIYFWMVANKIPKDCENWHLNRLITLVKVISQKNSPPKKMSQAEIAKRNRMINEKRLAEMQTSG